MGELRRYVVPETWVIICIDFEQDFLARVDELPAKTLLYYLLLILFQFFSIFKDIFEWE